MAGTVKNLAAAATIGAPGFRTGRLAAPIGLLALSMCCTAGVSYGAQKTVSTYYPVGGYALDAAVARNGDVLVSLGAGSSPPGIRVFAPGNGYANPCGGDTIINYEPLGMATVDGIQLFPRGNEKLGKNRESIGAAVEQNGAEFLRADLNTCRISGAVNVPQEPVTTPKPPKHGSPGSFTIAVTPDGRYAFIANEYGWADTSPNFNLNQQGTVGIVQTRRNAVGKFTDKTRQVAPYGYIYIPGADTIPGVTVSHDGKRLYVANEGTTKGNYPANRGPYAGNWYSNPTNLDNPDLSTDLCLNEYGNPTAGTALNGVVSVIDVEKAARGLGQGAVVQTIAAGCSPVRIVETEDGKYIFVASRGGNPTPFGPGSGHPAGSVGRILVYDVKKLVSPHRKTVNDSLVGIFDSGGTQPVGMALFGNDQWLAVANSNRFTENGTGKTSVAIFDVGNPAAPKRNVVCKSANQSSFPRGVSADGLAVYVANFGSPGTVAGALQVIDFAPGAKRRCKVGAYPGGTD